MVTPFEAAGFRSTPFSSAKAASAQAEPAPQSAPSTPTEAEPDKFVKNQTATEKENMKAEIRDELVREQEHQNLVDEIKAEVLRDIEKQKEEQEAGKKKGFVQSVNDVIGGIKKFFYTAGEYGKGLFKGIITGGIIGGVSCGGLMLANKILKNGIKGGKKLAIGVGVVGAAIGLGAQLWEAGLQANEKRASVDHRYKREPHVK